CLSPAPLSPGVISGGAQTDPTQIKNYLNRYTPGLSGQTAQATGTESVVITSETSTTTSSNLDPLATSPSPDTTSPAIAATQLSSASVQSAPWVADFLGTQEEEDLVVVL
ncbi:hypothetical protein, partial [Petrachloros mirabilis]